MTDRPILFSGPMVRALLDGRKTQTRRVLQPQPPSNVIRVDRSLRGPQWHDMIDVDGGYENADFLQVAYAVGARLWVREAHTLLPRTAYRGSVGTGTIEQVEHPTDGYTAAVFREGFDRSGRPRWRPGIHMPRWASRLTLTITDARVQRLQEISEADAIAEGAEVCRLPGIDGGVMVHTDHPCVTVSPGRWYRQLWDSLNAARGFGWDANPWVVAVSFTVEHRNIDEASK